MDIIKSGELVEFLINLIEEAGEERYSFELGTNTSLCIYDRDNDISYTLDVCEV